MQISISKSLRSSIVAKESTRVPGPGNYNNAKWSEMGKGGPKFGFAAEGVPPKKGSIGRSPSPGPGAYSLDRSAIVAN